MAALSRNGRILFVEDEDAISAPFSAALEREGFEPVVARTAAEALELAGRVEPDLVLLDLNLPDGDGRDVCRALRRDSDVPIVMLTARGTETRSRRRARDGRRRLRRQAVQRRRGDLADPRRAAPDPGVGPSRSRRSRSATSQLDVRRGSRRHARRASSSLTRKEFDLLAELARNARHGGHARGPDVAGLGHELVRLDQDARRPRRRRCGASSATIRLTPTHIETVRGVGFRFVAPEAESPVSLRRTLLLAIAYVLLLAVVALGVPLAVSLRDRVDAEVHEPGPQPGRRRRGERQRGPRARARSRDADSGSTTLGRELGPRAGDHRRRRGTVSPTAPGPRRARGQLCRPPRDQRRASTGDSYAADAPQRHARRRHPRHGGAGPRARGEPIGAVRVTQSVEAVDHAVRRSLLGIALLALVVMALGVGAGALIAQRIASPIRRLADAADEVAAGDLDARAPVEGSSEQRSLARSFNEMTGRVSAACSRASRSSSPTPRISCAPRSPGCGCSSRSSRPAARPTKQRACGGGRQARGRPACGDRRRATGPQPRRRARAARRRPSSSRAAADRAAARWRKAAAARASSSWFAGRTVGPRAKSACRPTSTALSTR